MRIRTNTLSAAVIIALVMAGSGAWATASDTSVRVLRAWDETIQVGDRTVKGRIELIFDYVIQARASAYRLIVEALSSGSKTLGAICARATSARIINGTAMSWQ